MQANSETVDILELTLPKILIYGDGGITVDVLIAFTEVREIFKREIFNTIGYIISRKTYFI